MRSIIALLSIITASYAVASPVQYSCKGKDQAGAERTFSFVHSAYAVSIVTDGGDEFTIHRRAGDQESSRGFAVYLDSEYDGYGGYLKFSMPRSIIEANVPATRAFTAYFTQVTYTELGRVGEQEIKARCQADQPSSFFARLAAQADKYTALVPTAIWMSEADYGWSPFYSLVPVSNFGSRSQIADALLSGNENIEVWSHKTVMKTLQSLATDSNSSAEERAEYSALLRALKRDFKELRGFKVGKPDSGALDLFIVGRTEDGYLVGIRTVTVET
jgi:hypothetical protein